MWWLKKYKMFYFLQCKVWLMIGWYFGKMYIVDGKAMNVVRVGDVCIALPNKSVWTLQQVRHIPKLKKSLIFVR